jgi:septum formation protein
MASDMRAGTAFVLASASPRRRELLARVGLRPEVQPSDVDESVRAGEAPDAYAVRVARDKARAGPGGAVLAAHTVVALEGVALGKAPSPEAAREMLARLSGRRHQVHTGVVLLGRRGEERARVVTTEVRFRSLSPEEIAAYVASGEPMDKAGAYGIQGRGGALVAEIHGSYTNVVGLPLEETLELLDAEGLR